jgi:citrate/tricarballylate utilization protein
MLRDAAHATAALTEADRLMVVCNACRYCEGLCAVFPAMERRRVFADGDLDYLANLCHGCGACYDACQFSPPHEFNVNVPRVLAQVRNDSYQTYAWPRVFSVLLARNAVAITVVAILSVACFILDFVARNDPSVVWGRSTGPGAFYRLMSHQSMVTLFGAIFIYAVVALSIGAARFWAELGTPPSAAERTHDSAWRAVLDAARLRYLDGGNGGCGTDASSAVDRRKLYHHLSSYGFLLCFASTVVATIYHYLLGWEAPYPWYALPVLLGSAGGIGLVLGPVGLLKAKLHRPMILSDERRFAIDVAFLSMLFLTGMSGLALLALRGTSSMGVLLAVHLGIVCALFISMPYGKFVHGIYRLQALLRYEREKLAHSQAVDRT